MKITLTIQTDNAAFSDGCAGMEVERILTKTAGWFRNWQGANEFRRGLYDVNGNKVGEVKTTGRAVRY